MLQLLPKLCLSRYTNLAQNFWHIRVMVYNKVIDLRRSNAWTFYAFFHLDILAEYI